MTKRSLPLITLVLSLLPSLAAGAVPAAPSVPARPSHPPGWVAGKVCVVDTAHRTVTMLDPGTVTPATVTLTADAQILLMSAGRIDDLKVGDTVTANGYPEGDGKTLYTYRITKTTPQPAPAQPHPGERLRRVVTGVIAGLKPTLTITTPDTDTFTLQTHEGTEVLVAMSGTMGDITPGSYAQAATHGPNDDMVQEIRVKPVPRVSAPK